MTIDSEFYQHTQKGTLIRRVLCGMCIGLLVIPAWLAFSGQPDSAVIAAMTAPIVNVLLLALFHSLTVTVSQGVIHLSFGVGLITKSFAIDEIQSCEAVQTSWINGWGIRKVSGGWLYNVSGFDAVAIEMASGKRHLIGTDQPAELTAAINNALTT